MKFRIIHFYSDDGILNRNYDVLFAFAPDLLVLIILMRTSLSRGSLMGGSVFAFFLPIGWFSDHPYENQPFLGFSLFFAVFLAFLKMAKQLKH